MSINKLPCLGIRDTSVFHAYCTKIILPLPIHKFKPVDITFESEYGFWMAFNPRYFEGDEAIWNSSKQQAIM